VTLVPVDYLRLAAFVAYLAAWVVFAIGAVISGIPRIQRRAASPVVLRTPVLIGTVLQVAPTMAFSLSMGDGPLRPSRLALAGILVSASFGAVLFIGAILSAPRDAGPPTLVTRGVYTWMRHPIYLAFLAMLVATGLLVSAGRLLLVAIAVYLAGSEMRIASEEEELAGTFHDKYDQYRLRTRWRYLPGLR
jgi:protein-S-isoprenylcysteine O-methyltransferase Ste14